MQKNRRVLEGVVISANMAKTVAVEVTRTQMHSVFGKYLRRRKSFLSHDEKSECKVGDRVEIVESRPLSKRKRWVVLRITQKGGEIVADTAGSAAGETPVPKGEATQSLSGDSSRRPDGGTSSFLSSSPHGDRSEAEGAA